MRSDDAAMRFRSLRLLTTVVAVVALALPAAGLGASQAATVDRGVVQSIDSSQIVIRSLDGSTISFPITPRTRVKLNRVSASLTDVAPGFVATVVADRKGRAVLIHAFGTSATTTDRGIVTSITSGVITLRTNGGGIVTVTTDAMTRVRFRGLPARRAIVRQGALVAVTHAADAPALLVDVLKRAGT
jgi:hypothetical protein